MVKKTSKVTKKTSKKLAQKRSSGVAAWFNMGAQREASTLNDVKTAVLLISLTINAAVFITWLILRLTTAYDQQVFDFLFVR